MPAPPPRPPTDPRVEPALVVIGAGVCAALHLAKLPPAIAALQQALGMTLVQAAFLLSLVQAAGMSLGVAFGMVADGLGARRSMVLGLALLSAASLLGGFAGVPMLMALRVVEGFGFLLVALPAPGLLRQLLPPARVSVMLGVWGAYMPTGAALALLVGPLWIGLAGWRAWWWGLALLSALMALWLARALSALPTVPASPAAARATGAGWAGRLGQTLSAPGPWLVALSFAVYSGQWLSVIGFLPTIYLQAGVSGAATGVLTALAAAVNVLGNMGSGRLLHRGWPAPRLLTIGFASMALAAVAAFAGGAEGGLPPALRYAAVLVFSGVGGLIPGTLFYLVVRLAPSDRTLSTAVGWMQQWSSAGQFAGPPTVAWVASQAGGWQFTWVVTGTSSLLGLGLMLALARLLARQVRPATAA
jgi:CP family cyanate transporter-like MFS transporter